jgi:RHS repeat-associated protein
VTAIQQCTSATTCSPLFTLAYDAAGRLVSILDRAGRRAEFAWNASGRLISARDALDVEQGWPGLRYTYFSTRLTSVTNSEGERIDYAYQGAALASATQVGLGSPVHRFQYEGKDGAGLYHTRFWNPLGEERRFAYDAQGRLLEQRELATGEMTRFAWGGERMTARTAANGAITQWVYSGDDASARIDPSGNTLQFSYAPAGVDREKPHARPIAAIRDSLGAVETRSYDGAGRLVRIVNGAGEVTAFGWAQGALASRQSGGVTQSYTQIGEHGHAERVMTFGYSEARSFDAVGNLLRGSDGRSPLAGGVELRAFDADRNLRALTLQPLGAASGPETITLEHRSDGQLARVLRGGDDHEFVYDDLGRLVEQRERVDGVWKTTRFGRDAAGRVSFARRPNGMREELGYGPADRIASVRRLRGGVLESTLAFSYEAGALVRVDDSESGSEQYVYDAAGRRISTRFADAERLELAYDLRSRVVAESFVSGQGSTVAALLYEYDLADRQLSVADPGGELLGTGYASGRLAEQRYGNGLRRSFSYDSDGVFSGTSTRDAGGGLVEQTTFSSGLEIDEEGTVGMRQRATTATYAGVAVTTVEDYFLAPFPSSGQQSYGMRIARWSDAVSDEAYAFDARSNLLAMGDTQFAYNAEGNRLLQVTRAGQPVGSYSYDAAGFATSRNGSALAWNAAGRLVAHGADTLAWDGLGRLREAQVGGTSAHFRFGGRVQADASGNPLAIDLGEVVIGLGGVHRYRHLDFRGNVKWISDDAGQVVAHYRYAPFGLDAVFGADDDPVRFVARPEIGELMLLGARVYDPAVGRFLSPDPIFQTVNQFAYTLGNPVWFSDPDGFSADAAGKVADALDFAAANLAALGQVLLMSPSPQTRTIGEGLLLLAAILFALAAAIRLMGVAVAGPSVSAGGGGGGGGGSFGTGGSPGCAPGVGAALPRLRGWLPVLLPLQLLLGFLLLRRRREERA